MNLAGRLYLFTLEVVPLKVGDSYKTLPSHLTLVPRFYSTKTPEIIAEKAREVFSKAPKQELRILHSNPIGPHKTQVHGIQVNLSLKDLHSQIVQQLNSLPVRYTQPEYINDGWVAHISKRHKDAKAPGDVIISCSAYLIEVEKTDAGDIRTIREQFILSNEIY